MESFIFNNHARLWFCSCSRNRFIQFSIEMLADSKIDKIKLKEVNKITNTTNTVKFNLN